MTVDRFRHSHVRWLYDFTEYKNKFMREFGKAIYDYTVLVVFGEARHAKKVAHAYNPHIPQGEGRSEQFIKAKQYNDKSILLACEQVFNPAHVVWGLNHKTSYGGKAWWTIAKAGLMYGHMDLAIWIDHCIDLSHNNGTYFNKHQANLFKLDNDYQSYLNFKRDCTYPAKLLRNISYRLFNLIERGLIIDALPSSITGWYSYDDSTENQLFFELLYNHYNPIKWGYKQIPLKIKLTDPQPNWWNQHIKKIGGVNVNDKDKGFIDKHPGVVTGQYYHGDYYYYWAGKQLEYSACDPDPEPTQEEPVGADTDKPKKSVKKGKAKAKKPAKPATIEGGTDEDGAECFPATASF